MAAEPSVHDLQSEADAAFARGAWEEALRGHLAVVRAAPRFAPARFRVADALLNLGHREAAKGVYKGLAWHHIRGGRPLPGLVATKMVLALDPGLDDLLVILAELYSSESDRTGDVDAPPAFELPTGAPAQREALEGPALAAEAARVAADTDAITEIPELLPPIPLFSHLGEEAFLAVLGSLRLRRFGPGELIIREGEVGDSFFMLAGGEVAVSRNMGGEDTLLARLHRGAVFGEMALVSRAPRVATVRAAGDVDALELDRADLETHAGQLESVKKALKKFTRGRFLANLAATSPLFESLSRPDRRALMGRFRPQRVFPGDVLIEEGERGRGLYLVLSGQMRVSARRPEGEVQLARLRGGDVFGEISLLHDAPTTASVTADAVGEVLFLPREDFSSVLETYPAVAATLRAMSAERLAERRRAAGVVVTDDAGVLL
jgi:CRP-like cAMP-binding protein